MSYGGPKVHYGSVSGLPRIPINYLAVIIVKKRDKTRQNVHQTWQNVTKLGRPCGSGKAKRFPSHYGLLRFTPFHPVLLRPTRLLLRTAAAVTNF